MSPFGIVQRYGRKRAASPFHLHFAEVEWDLRGAASCAQHYVIGAPHRALVLILQLE